MADSAFMDKSWAKLMSHHIATKVKGEGDKRGAKGPHPTVSPSPPLHKASSSASLARGAR